MSFTGKIYQLVLNKKEITKENNQFCYHNIIDDNETEVLFYVKCKIILA